MNTQPLPIDQAITALGLTEQEMADYLNRRLWRCFKLTEADKKYIERDGLHCPNPQCKNGVLRTTNRPTVIDDSVIQSVRCTSCGIEFTDIYALIGIDQGETKA